MSKSIDHLGLGRHRLNRLSGSVDSLILKKLASSDMLSGLRVLCSLFLMEVTPAQFRVERSRYRDIKMKYVATLAMVLCVWSTAGHSANAQIVTSFFAPNVAPGAELTAAPFAPAAPAFSSVPVMQAVPATVIGSIPVRRGLFGLRTEFIPVYSSSVPVAAAFPAAPITSGFAPVTAASPVISPMPNAVIQSGFRGVMPGFGVSPVGVAPQRVITFFPGAIMTMQ